MKTLTLNKPINAFLDTLQLLLPIFPDVEVRKKAVEWLEEETNDTIHGKMIHK